MGLFGWLKRVFTGSADVLVQRFFGEGMCPYCGVKLRTPQARQCFECGVSWHNPQRVVRLGKREIDLAPGWRRKDPVLAETADAPPSPKPQPTATPSPSAKRKAPDTLGGLDLGTFAPLTHDEARKQSRDLDSPWGNPWFGRRDLIPPVTDQRTVLIDRAMVGQGLITPEELAEIHHVGDMMDSVRPDLVMAAEIAKQAVARSEAERQQIKLQKRAEAAERKRLRQEAIDKRHRTDIMFLGRGVSRGLADRRANVERLQQLGLPVLATPADVATALELEISQLRWLAYHTDAATRSHYISFCIPKRSGGQRRLSAPHQRLRRCQQWILRNILDKVPCHDAAHGFVPGRSTLSGAQQHVGRDVLINADLEDFFPTVTFPRVKGAFRSVGYSPAAATILALLCTDSPRRTIQYDGKTYHVALGPRSLPQGACTSPALSNLVARRLDKRLAGIAGKLGWTYTRYADDLTLAASGEPAAKTGYMLARLRHIADDEGFAVNEKKTRVQRRNSRQSVTGVVVNHRTSAPRPLIRRLRAILHRAKREGLARQNRENLHHFDSWLLGMIAYVSMLNPEQGGRLRAAYEELQP